MAAPEKQAIEDKGERSPAMTAQQQALTERAGSPLELYRCFAVGEDASWWSFFVYEVLTTCLSGLPGVVGYGLRSMLYPALFARCDSRPALGRGVVLRGGKSISLGKKVLIDDYAALDCRGGKGKITLASHASLGRYSTIAAKNGEISLGAGANIGSYCRLATQSNLSLGESSLIAAYCYLGPGNHKSDDDQTPLISSEMENRGGVTIGKHVWIGAHSTVLDGAVIGDGAIIGAHSLVRDHIPAGAIAAGVPAKVIREK